MKKTENKKCSDLLDLRASYTWKALGERNLSHLEKLFLIGLIQTAELLDGKVFCDLFEVQEIMVNWLTDVSEAEYHAAIDSLIAKGCIAPHYNKYGMVGYDILIKGGQA